MVTCLQSHDSHMSLLSNPIGYPLSANGPIELMMSLL